MIVKTDKRNRFVSFFDPSNGKYVRTGVLDDKGKDTGVDPFMASFPELLDIGIMQTCVCSNKCNVDCYQKASDRSGHNMSIENYENIMKQCQGRVFQCACGGAGDVDTHENFKEILEISRKYGIIPNFTTSGIAMTKEKAELCKAYCGSVAVSEHFADYTENALDMLLEAGVSTNIHFVLNNQTIDIAIDRLRNNSFKKGITAVVFLLYKPVGHGVREKVLTTNDPKVKDFFELIDTGNFHHSLGFDSCTAPGIINYTKNIDLDTLDYCEGARFSAYIDANMNMMPCSFANQDSNWHMNLNEYTIQEVWDSELFNRFRYSLRNSCKKCPSRSLCGGGCPLLREIVLCNRKEKDLK